MSDQSIHLLDHLVHASPNSLTGWDLLCLQDKTLSEFYDTLNFLLKQNFVLLKDGFVDLTSEGKKWYLEQVGGEKVHFKAKCAQCEGKGYVASDPVFLTNYKKILEGRPLPAEEYDQTSITAEDAIIRVFFFHERGDLVNKELLFIGDFDCLSIVAALTRLPKRILVLDVDDRLIDYINKVAVDHNMTHLLKAEKFDVRLPLPENYQKAFDLFSCDPVETLDGIKLYISRGTSGLKSIGSSAYIGLTTLEASRKKWFDIERALFDMNFVITDIKRNFNGYPDTGLEEKHIFYQKLGSVPNCVWYWAALLRCELVDEPKPAVTGKYEADHDIYMDEEAWATPVLDKTKPIGSESNNNNKN